MIKLLPLELSDAPMQHTACSPRPSRSFPRLPLISWPSPTSFSSFHPSFSSFSLSSLLFLPSLLFSAFPSNIPCHLLLVSSLSSKVCLPLPQFSLSSSHYSLPPHSCLTSGCPGGAHSVQAGSAEDPRLLFRQRQTQPNPIAANLWAAACALRMRPFPDMSLGAEGTSKGRQM